MSSTSSLIPNLSLKYIAASLNVMFLISSPKPQGTSIPFIPRNSSSTLSHTPIESTRVPSKSNITPFILPFSIFSIIPVMPCLFILITPSCCLVLIISSYCLSYRLSYSLSFYLFYYLSFHLSFPKYSPCRFLSLIHRVSRYTSLTG